MNSRGICFFILAFAMAPMAVRSQNLVPNGSFEEFLVCPGGYTQHPAEFKVPSWRALTLGSPDYFNSCSEGEASVPYNWAGVSDAFDGYGYVGIYTWLNVKDYREYLHCQLREPLVKDSLYHIEFRYKLSSYAKFSTDRIGLLLSDSLATRAHDRPLGLKPSVSFVKDSALTPETGAWELAVADYRARGNERFLTIGNFDDNAATGYYHIQFRAEQEPMLAVGAYYYIDDVRVTPKFNQPPESANLLPAFSGGEPELNTTYVLKNIQFEFNSFTLMPDSYFDLDNVIAYLQDNPDVSIALSGHTDDVGESTYNDSLSLNRARSAAAYLMSRGVSKGRISVLGHGERKPLVDETTEEARELNRRVEITFTR
jgi:OOP family OmpA-OmpF porin